MEQASRVVLCYPVCMGPTNLWEAWYCQLCKKSFVVTTLISGDDVKAVRWDKKTTVPMFDKIPKPWNPLEPDE